MIPFLLPKPTPRRLRAKRIPTLWQRIRHLDLGGTMLCNMCGRPKIPQEYHTEAGERKLILLCFQDDAPSQQLTINKLGGLDSERDRS